jgi:hypothetical protein
MTITPFILLAMVWLCFLCFLWGRHHEVRRLNKFQDEIAKGIEDQIRKLRK